MKTFATIVVGSVLGIGITYLCVPRREPERIPPSRFELPGEPLAVDGHPTPTWDDVNHALREVTRQATDSDLYSRIEKSASELAGPEVRITYVPRLPRIGATSTIETVVVRPCFPISVPYSREHPVELVRYERVLATSPE